LCDNAIKFASEGGAYRICIRRNEKQKILVSVYNAGVGIAREDLPFIFDRFYKTDKSRGLDKSGAGLGLYIAKTIMEAQGESISVESELGKYCEFTFTLSESPKKA
jgi:signal transduction histidine kinase